MTAGA